MRGREVLKDIIFVVNLHIRPVEASEPSKLLRHHQACYVPREGIVEFTMEVNTYNLSPGVWECSVEGRYKVLAKVLYHNVSNASTRTTSMAWPNVPAGCWQSPWRG